MLKFSIVVTWPAYCTTFIFLSQFGMISNAQAIKSFKSNNKISCNVSARTISSAQVVVSATDETSSLSDFIQNRVRHHHQNSLVCKSSYNDFGSKKKHIHVSNLLCVVLGGLNCLAEQPISEDRGNVNTSGNTPDYYSE